MNEILTTENGWWCPKCNTWVDGNQVTYTERHELCGCPVFTEKLYTSADLRAAKLETVERCIELVQESEGWLEVYADLKAFKEEIENEG